MHHAIGGHDAVASRKLLVATIVRYPTASLHHNQCTSHIVPLPNVTLGITIQTTSSNIAQGHGRRTNHADTAHTTIEVINQPLNHGLIGIAVIRQLQT